MWIRARQTRPSEAGLHYIAPFTQHSHLCVETNYSETFGTIIDATRSLERTSHPSHFLLGLNFVAATLTLYLTEKM